MLIKLFVLHNEPTGHSLFLVNFKQAGQPEFVLTFLTPKCLLSLSDLSLIFSEMGPFLFFLFPHIFLKDVSENGTDRKSTQFWFVSNYLFIAFSKVSLFGIIYRGFHLNLLWKAMEFDKHFEHFVTVCFVSGFVLRELEVKQDLSLPLRSLKSNWTREATVVNQGLYVWVFDITGFGVSMYDGQKGPLVLIYVTE